MAVDPTTGKDTGGQHEVHRARVGPDDDIATIDRDGWLRIVDRKKDMIVVSGFKVFPNEVEEVAVGFEGVLEAACIGVDDEESGEVRIEGEQTWRDVASGGWHACALDTDDGVGVFLGDVELVEALVEQFDGAVNQLRRERDV